jgi:phage-related protein
LSGLRDAAAGLRPRIAKDWKGQGGGVWELAITRKDAYRCVILVRYADVMYICAAFKKKSHEGRKTPAHIVDRVARRIAAAEADYKKRQTEKTKDKQTPGN